jgi:hypothetical protein
MCDAGLLEAMKVAGGKRPERAVMHSAAQVWSCVCVGGLVCVGVCVCVRLYASGGTALPRPTQAVEAGC